MELWRGCGGEGLYLVPVEGLAVYALDPPGAAGDHHLVGGVLGEIHVGVELGHALAVAVGGGGSDGVVDRAGGPEPDGGALLPDLVGRGSHRGFAKVVVEVGLDVGRRRDPSGPAAWHRLGYRERL